MFCSQCGTKAIEGALFCASCGTGLEQIQVTEASKTLEEPQIMLGSKTSEETKITLESKASVEPLTPDSSRVTVRYYCSCGNVFDGSEEQKVCPRCGKPLVKEGFIQLYRMGNYMGCAVGMGIYIDNIPCGHIGNKQSVRIAVPYGPHKIHVTHTTTRSCNDPIFTVTPENPCIWCKAHFSKAGFAINVEQATPESMPKR